MREEIVFSNLGELVNEKDIVSASYKKDNWKLFEYETGMCKGNMLVAPEDSYPGNLSFDLNLEGLYHIYICIPKLRATNYLNLKLSSDPGYMGVFATDHIPFNWTTEEFFEEVYWKTADLTGEKFMIRKSRSAFLSATALAWIRCVPAEQEPAKATNKCVQMHIDEDIPMQDSLETDADYLAKLYPIKDTNAEFVSFEFGFDFECAPERKEDHLLHMDALWDEAHYKYMNNKDTVYKNAVKFAKESGFGIYAANRMQVSNFITPFTRYGWNMKFVEENPQFLSETRTGTKVNVCSYAYPEVQDFVINQFKNVVKHGFDGITLIWHRGHFIGFDKPVLDRFAELYPGVDPRTLPIKDERLHGVWCEFMNEFMRKLREAMGKDIKINTINDYSLETSKHLGLDVEHWAKNGYVDSVCQADMETFEDLEDCMDDNNRGLIDLEKYKYQLTQKTVVRRKFGKNVEKVCAHIPEYKNLKTLYGVEVYHVLPWVRRTMPEGYPPIIEQMVAAGAEKFLSWNTNHLMGDLPEWNTVKTIGNEPTTETLRTFHRVLSIDGYDISQFHPNWRG
ncbi:MAG: hypothetical protein IKW02_01050 [Clostridia bacterium]|nr:hypothetical protein [Clostridia bacterium]